MSERRIYETVFVLHPDLSEEDVAAMVQSTVELLEVRGSEIIRMEPGGKRRLAYSIEKQRFGFYTLIHFRGTSEALVELERMYRLNDKVMRYLTVRFDKEDQLTGLTRIGDDEGRDDDRDDRRRGRRGDFQGRGRDRDERGRDRDSDRDDRRRGRNRDEVPDVLTLEEDADDDLDLDDDFDQNDDMTLVVGNEASQAAAPEAELDVAPEASEEPL